MGLPFRTLLSNVMDEEVVQELLIKVAEDPCMSKSLLPVPSCSH